MVGLVWPSAGTWNRLGWTNPATRVDSALSCMIVDESSDSLMNMGHNNNNLIILFPGWYPGARLERSSIERDGFSGATKSR